MDLHSRTVAPKVAHFNARAGQFINRMARGWDSALSTLHLGGRKAQYDDYSYEFIGGANDEMVGRHSDGLNNVFADGHVTWMRLVNVPPRASTSKYWNGAYTGTNP